MKIRVELNHWVHCSGFSHSETFDNIEADSKYTATDYIHDYDGDLADALDLNDGIRVELYDIDNNLLSKAWVRG